MRHVSDTYDSQELISGVVHTKANNEEDFATDAMPRGASSLDVSS